MKIRILLFFFGSGLLAINIYGQFQDLEPNIQEIDQSYGLRFPYKKKETFERTIFLLEKDMARNKIYDQVVTLNALIKNRMTHPNWNKIPPGEFNISVPIWENYIIYIASQFYREEMLQRYHFSGYKKSLERGIGICGDSSVILSSIMKLKGISHKIVSFDGHVIVAFSDENAIEYYADPDFNVIFPSPSNKSIDFKKTYEEIYKEQGYSQEEIEELKNIYSGKPVYFSDHIHFMTKRYYFEKISYLLKWLIPIIFMIQLVIPLPKHK